MRGLSEIDALQRANPKPAEGGGLARPTITRAIGRAEVVLLSSHLERYVRAVVEEMASCIDGANVCSTRIPKSLRLLHGKVPVDELASIQWERREIKLREFAETEASMWQDGNRSPRIQTDRLLRWMSTPNATALERVFRYWGIDSIFAAITRKDSHRRRIRLKIDELTEKRNNIAHGDFTVEATHLDIRSYRRAVREFCERADRSAAAIVQRIGQLSTRPW
ncbi:MAG: HEPN domain-containing protein [Chloroflexi bacterium]|nr:HEPN domain-containing protein [Chloroflexota bacterium]